MLAAILEETPYSIVEKAARNPMSNARWRLLDLLNAREPKNLCATGIGFLAIALPGGFAKPYEDRHTGLLCRLLLRRHLLEVHARGGNPFC